MCLMQYIAQDHCTNYRADIETETYLKHCQTFKMECFVKRIMCECSCTNRNFSGLGSGTFVELQHFNKDFVKSTRKRDPGETFWSFFSYS